MDKKKEAKVPTTALQLISIFTTLSVMVYFLIVSTLIFSFAFATYEAITGKWMTTSFGISLAQKDLFGILSPGLVADLEGATMPNVILYLAYIPLLIICGLSMYIYNDLRIFSSKLKKKEFLSSEVIVNKVTTFIKFGWIMFAAEIVFAIIGGDSKYGINSTSLLVILYILKYFIESKYITINDKK